MLSYAMCDALKHIGILLIFLGFFVTTFATWLLCRLSKVLNFGQDSSHGVQKFHVNPTSRLGGVAIFLGFSTPTIAASIVETLGLTSYWLMATGGCTETGKHISLATEFEYYSFWFLLTATPVWLVGLTEDLTHKVGPSLRLVMAIISAAWLYGTLGISVNRTDVWPIDVLLSIPGATLFVTLLVVSGFTHSVNIVDGFHGLACGLVMIAMSSLAVMAWNVGDTLLFKMCLTSLAVVLGFFVFNWPKGAIFLGDAGAYLIGFWVVELGILLAMRNPQISPMAPVMAGLLPLIETLFSMYRRSVIRNNPVNQPDALHLHTLVYKRILYNPSMQHTTDQLNAINAKVAIFFWVPAAIFASFSCIFAENTEVQLVLMLIYLIMYNWLYMRLVCFNVPAFMRFR